MQSSEWLFFALLLAAIIGFNLVMQALIRRNKQRRQRDQDLAPERAAAAAAPEESPSYWGRTPARELVPEQPHPSGTTPESATVPRQRSGHHRKRRAPLFRNQREMRRAIVTMTVLGPCRAMQPYDQDAGGPAR